MKTYIAKPNTWFKEGTKVQLIEYLTVDKDNVKYGVFEGVRDGVIGDVLCQEVCAYNEFDITDNE